MAKLKELYALMDVDNIGVVYIGGRALVDPTHDGAVRMLAYAKQHGCKVEKYKLVRFEVAEIIDVLFVEQRLTRLQ